MKVEYYTIPRIKKEFDDLSPDEKQEVIERLRMLRVKEKEAGGRERRGE